jgi:hypothetical protein
LDHPGSVKAVGHSHNDSLTRLKRKSDPARAGMGSYDLPTVVKLLEIHGGVAHTFCLEVGKDADH